MSSRFALHRLLTITVLSILLISMAGCFRSGDGGGTPLIPPSVEFRGLKNLQYNSMIPVSLWVETSDAINVMLSLTFKQGTEGPFGPITPVPGKPDPTSYPQLKVPSGGAQFVFWWHAVADLPPGQSYGQVWLKATVMLQDGTLSEIVFGPMTIDYSGALGGNPPPYVEGGSLPATLCGEKYETHLTLTGGHPPFEWSLLPPGSHLPYFLNFLHNGTIKGTIPDGYGPVTINFFAQARDSNPILVRESAGAFSIFIDCVGGPGCAPEPEIQFSSMPDAIEGEPYFYTCDAHAGEGLLTWSIIEGSLPANLSLASNGQITGTCSGGTAGTHEFTIQVCDSCPDGVQCDTVDISLRVNEAGYKCDDGPTITTTTLPTAYEGTLYGHTLLAAGGHGELAWTLADDLLPPGMFITEGGQISGTPAAGTGGDDGNIYIFTIEVCDSCPLGEQCNLKELSLIVSPEIPCAAPPIIQTTSPIPDATEGIAYSVTFMALGGEGALSWLLNNPDKLPASLIWSPSGTINGTPDVGTASTYMLDITVNDSCSPIQSANGIFELNVREACADPPVITTSALDTAIVGTPYLFQMEATGGDGLLTWTRIGGPAFPTGLTLQTDGLIFGTPAAGTAKIYNDIEIQVADSCPGGSQTHSNLFNLVVSESCIAGPVITTTELDTALEGKEYNFEIQATGGQGSLHWEILDTNDMLPLSVVFSDGIISGIPDPDTEGVYNINFQVCDSCPAPQCDTALLEFEVALPCGPGPTITTTVIPPADVGVAYEFYFSAVDGEGTLEWLPENNFQLPVSFALEFDGRLHGTALPAHVGDWAVNIIVRDSCWLGVQRDLDPFVFTVNPAGCADPPTIISAPSSSGPEGFIVDFRMIAENGQGRLTWTLVDATPALPGTVVFGDDGWLKGTTSIGDAGSYMLDVEVCDECTDPGPQCDTMDDFELILDSAAGCGAGPPVITDLTIPAPTADGSPYNYTMSATGGDGTLSWFAVGLPPGISMNFSTGELAGSVQPVDAGDYIVSIGVMDSCLPIPQANSRSYIWNIT